MATIDDILNRKQPNRRTVWMPYDAQLAEAYQEAEAQRDVASNIATVRVDDKEAASKLIEAEEKLAELKATLRAESIKFVFRAVGRKRYEELVMAHQPTNKQLQKAREQRQDAPDFNEDTFPQAIVAACLEEPVLSPEEVNQLWDSEEFSIAEQRMLLQTAVMVNQQWRVVDLGKD
jgi:hypothetical protein